MSMSRSSPPSAGRFVRCATVAGLAASLLGPASIADAQIPIIGGLVAVYTVELITDSSQAILHVVVRSPTAGGVGSPSLDSLTEYWFVASSTSQGGTPGMTMELVLLREASDPELVSAVDDILQNETSLGTADAIPSWTAGAPTGAGVTMFSLDQVTGGPGTYGDVIGEVAMGWQFSGADPLAPTVYAADAVHSLFGGAGIEDAPIQEGMVATFAPVDPQDADYPDATWGWCGRFPN